MLLQRIINFGEKKALCRGIDFKIEMPKVNNQKTEDLSPEQLQKLLDSIENDPNIQAANSGIVWKIKYWPVFSQVF